MLQHWLFDLSCIWTTTSLVNTDSRDAVELSVSLKGIEAVVHFLWLEQQFELF